MSETTAHKSAKCRAAGSNGTTESSLPSGDRLDARTAGGGRAIEIERSGNPAKLTQAANRLKQSGCPQKVLQVPQKDIQAAKQALQSVGIGGTVKNMGGTRAVHVPKKG